MSVFRFRLQALLDHRTEEQKQAEELLTRRQKEFTLEQQRLAELNAEFARLAEQHKRKRAERCGAELLSAARIARQADYLLVLGLDLQAAQSGIMSQEVFVEQAREAVEEAQQQLAACRRKVDVLTKFREKAEMDHKLNAARQEELEQDEIGNLTYLVRRSM